MAGADMRLDQDRALPKWSARELFDTPCPGVAHRRRGQPNPLIAVASRRMPQGPAVPPHLVSAQVLFRFGLRLGILSAFALLAGRGFAATLVSLLALAAVCCGALAAGRREPLFGPVLTHWDEAVVFALASLLFSTLA